MASSKRGQLGFELVWVVIVLLVVGLGFVMTYSAFSGLNDDIQNSLDMSNESKAAAEATVGNFPSNMDNVFFFLLIMLWIFLLIMAFFVNTHPVFLVITLLLIVIGLVVVMILSNVFQESIEEGEIDDFAAEFPKMNWIFEHLLMVFIMVGFSTMMVMYTRARS